MGALHCPAAGAYLGSGGVSYVEMLIMYELLAGERLVPEKAAPRYRRPLVAQFQCRLFFLIQALIFGVLFFIGGMMRAFGTLSGGLGQFLPCNIGRSVGMGLLPGLGRRPRFIS